MVDEEWLLRLERKAFVELAKTPQPQARVEQMLKRLQRGQGDLHSQPSGGGQQVVSSTRVKVDKSEFCEQNPHDPICDENGNRANSQCDNLRDPLSTDSTCNFTLREPRGYSTWTGTIGASGTYYILIRGSSRLAGPIEYKLTAGGDGLSMK